MKVPGLRLYIERVSRVERALDAGIELGRRFERIEHDAQDTRRPRPYERDDPPEADPPLPPGVVGFPLGGRRRP
jgi:hypothetical protein